MILVVFTASYPYALGSERTFLKMELPYLAGAFNRVILVPEKHECEYPEKVLNNIEIEDGYFEHLRAHGRLRTFLQGLLSSLVPREMLSKPWLLRKPSFLKRLLFFAGQAELTRSWVRGWIRLQGIKPRDCLFYTYWFDQGTLGIGLAKELLPDLKVVSRAHGYDIYEARRTPPYWPCREDALRLTDVIYPDSDAGTDYLCEKYSRFKTRVKTAHLGVSDPGQLTRPSSDGVFRIVSCSRILPVKRVGLMLEGIRSAANRRQSQRFEWSHFGTGPEQSELERAIEDLPGNMNADFAGYSGQAELFKYYRENPVDVFINLSSSEGTSVAIMEAISCGIPVIATAVGGNKEIVSETNGFLLSANPSPEEVADKILSCLDEPGDRRAGSREMWRRRYDAKRNYSAFVRDLIEVRSQV